jgi:hypothetical protein
MQDEFRPFVIEVRRRWTLWILPILAALYFLAVLLLEILDYRIKGVSTGMLALVGVGLFVLVMLIEIPFLFRRGAPREPKPAKVKKAAAAAASAPAGRGDDELLITEETQQGLQVLEYSNPAKSRSPNAVYTKTYVPVTKEHVMRIETAVADASDI